MPPRGTSGRAGGRLKRGPVASNFENGSLQSCSIAPRGAFAIAKKKFNKASIKHAQNDSKIIKSVPGVLVFGLVRTPSAMRGVVVFTQFFLHMSLGHPFTMAFSVPHLHAEGLIMLGGQEGRTPSRINVDVVMREIMVVSTREKNRLTAALVIALAIVQTIRTLTYCSRGGQDAHCRKVLGGPV